MSVGPTAPRAEGAIRNAAVARVAGVTRAAGRGGFGPEPGREGGTLQGKVEARNRANAERTQDKREAREGVYRGGSRPGPIPPNRPGPNKGRGPYGSNRNYPQTV